LSNNPSFEPDRFIERIEIVKPVICYEVPLYHAFGCVGGFIVSALTKETLVFPSESFDPKESLVKIQELKSNSYQITQSFI